MHLQIFALIMNHDPLKQALRSSCDLLRQIAIKILPILTPQLVNEQLNSQQYKSVAARGKNESKPPIL